MLSGHIGVKKGEISRNVKVKEYPNHFELCVASSDFFLESGWELRSDGLTKVKPKKSGHVSDAESLLRCVNRARRNVRDIALCSGFTHFITLTIAPDAMDRYNYNEIIKRLNRWLSNAVQRHAFSYVIVPELHKDGAVHFHGLCAGDMKYIDSGKKTAKKQQILNMANWTFGFSACIEIDPKEYERTVNYILKYITKDASKVGGRWYLSGGKIAKPRVFFLDMEYRDVDAVEYYVSPARVSFKYVRVDKNSDDGLQIKESKPI